MKLVATFLDLPKVSEEECILEVISNAVEKGGAEVVETVDNYLKGSSELEGTNMEELELRKSPYEELAKKMESLAKENQVTLILLSPSADFSPLSEITKFKGISDPQVKKENCHMLA